MRRKIMYEITVLEGVGRTISHVALRKDAAADAVLAIAWDQLYRASQLDTRAGHDFYAKARNAAGRLRAGNFEDLKFDEHVPGTDKSRRMYLSLHSPSSLKEPRYVRAKEKLVNAHAALCVDPQSVDLRRAHKQARRHLQEIAKTTDQKKDAEFWLYAPLSQPG